MRCPVPSGAAHDDTGNYLIEVIKTAVVTNYFAYYLEGWDLFVPNHGLLLRVRDVLVVDLLLRDDRRLLDLRRGQVLHQHRGDDRGKALRLLVLLLEVLRAGPHGGE